MLHIHLSFTVEDYICYISDHFEDELIDDIKLAEGCPLLADESTNKADRSELSVFVRYLDPLKHCPVEKFLGITQVEHSKTAADLAEIINNFFIEKGIDISKIKFTGLDGTSAMSSDKVRLQQRLWHFSPYSIYLNCRNHRSALCLVHLVKQFPELLNLDKLLIATWKICSSIKNSIFLEAQEAINLKPLKILKACTTR